MRVKRLLDVILSLVGVVVLGMPILLIALIIKLTSSGPAIHWSDRVGRHNHIFRMPKFRTMVTDTPDVATHLLQNPEQYITPVGRFLRKTSLDELPQIWSILTGDMTIVGPRPALFNQHDLVELRTQAGVHELVPGLTGWAQINGRDELPIKDKVSFDIEYMEKQGLWLDLKIIGLTIVKAFHGHNVTH